MSIQAQNTQTPAPSDKLRVLFVDDEAAILRTLQDLLEDAGQDWDMQFVETANEALQKVRDWQPQVVVSDQNMPVMSGTELLQKVREEHPSALRIILSGQPGLASDEDDLSKRFLQKPLKIAKLMEMVATSQRMEAFVPDAALRKDVATLASQPLLKPAERRLMGEMDRPEASLSRVASMVENDAELAAMTLKKVRSAGQEAPKRVQDPAKAALMLGFDSLRALVLSAGSFRTFDPGLQTLADQLALTGTGVARAARAEARKMGGTLQEQNEAFTAGMLHNIGVLALSTLRAEQVEQYQAAHPYEWPADHEEIRHFGATHAGVGAYLLSLWGLPESVVKAVANQMNPEDSAPSLVLQALGKVTTRTKADTSAAVAAYTKELAFA